MPTGSAHIEDRREWDSMKRVIAPNDESYPCWLHINKNGTTTMAHLLREIPGGLNAYFHHHYPVHREVICMWRDPVERIESAYRMYHRNNVHGWGDKSFDYFIRHICENKNLRDPHHMPQYEVATNRNGRFVPDRVLKWDWSAVEELYGIKPKVHNHTPGDPQVWTPELREIFERRYWLDFHIWHQR